jgi:hypothetical protein
MRRPGHRATRPPIRITEEPLGDSSTATPGTLGDPGCGFELIPSWQARTHSRIRRLAPALAALTVAAAVAPWSVDRDDDNARRERPVRAVVRDHAHGQAVVAAAVARREPRRGDLGPENLRPSAGSPARPRRR